MRVLMKRRVRHAIIALLVLCIIAGCSAGNAVSVNLPAETTKEMDQGSDIRIDAESADPDYDENAELQELRYLMNLNLRYILHDWWNGDKIYVFDDGSSYYNHEELTRQQQKEISRSTKSFQNWEKERYLYICMPDIRGNDENTIRPISHAVYCIAAALYLGYYDESITGVSAANARNMCVRLISSAAAIYKENKKNGWGEVWQSPLWAENIGFAAWLLWEDIPERDQKNVTGMILREAAYVTDHYDIPYYRDRDGNIIYEGDTKGEEIAWHAKILALAAVMYPEHERQSDWEEKQGKMLIASTATPEDAADSFGFLEGSNINSDGTAVNHHKIHVDYMTTICEEMGECIAVYRLAGREIPQEAVFNMDLIYRALVNVDLGDYNPQMAGQHFYMRDAAGNPTDEATMPEANDWGLHWYANCYLTDVMADSMELDKEIAEPYKAAVWRHLHLQKIKDQICRVNEEGVVTGQFFREGENDFVSGELFQMHNLVEAYIINGVYN
ncbi:MAG: hypothetical protein IJV14_16805 [Lachnospiraceae bacterium]|nr:hypothetical protein [Lachnospiraceae bacterium]